MALGKYKLNISSVEFNPVKLPKEFRLFRYGANDSDKGTFLLTDDSCKEIMDCFKKAGRKLMIDYDHASLDPKPIDPSKSSMAAGFFRLRVDPMTKDLIACDVQWTPRATEMLRSGEFKYFSPAFFTNDDGEVIKIINCALTNNPALFNLSELTMASMEKLFDDSILNQQYRNIQMTDINNDSELNEQSLENAQAEIEALKAQLKASQKLQVDALILNAIKETKLDPKHRSYAEEIANDKGVEGLKKYLNTLSPKASKPLTQSFVAAPVESVEPVEAGSDDPMAFQLSNRMQECADQLGIGRKRFIKNMLRSEITVATPGTITAVFDPVAAKAASKK